MKAISFFTKQKEAIALRTGNYNDLTAEVLPPSFTGVHSEVPCINCSLNEVKAVAETIA